MVRLYPLIVSLLGSLGLGLGLTYFVGVYLSFHPDFEDWAAFFVPRAIPLMVVPYVLLVAHMVLRYSLGQWFLSRGAVSQAREYSSKRLNKNLLRGKREALKHRLVFGQVLANEGAYEEALTMLNGTKDVPRRGAMAFDYARWKMEVSLRLDDRPAVEEAYASVSKLIVPVRERASVLAARAELALRDAEDDLAREMLEKALWAHAESQRATLSRTLSLIEHGQGDEDWREALGLLELVQPPTCNDIPGRTAEFEAYRALLLGRLGDQDNARAALQRARSSPTDVWSEAIVEMVSQRLEG
ncbi:MAG: tetratricopeptide repeat protein [Bradymonadaceae bacterium]